MEKLFSGGDTQLQNVFVRAIMGSDQLLTGIFFTTTRLCLAALSTNESPAHFELPVKLCKTRAEWQFTRETCTSNVFPQFPQRFYGKALSETSFLGSKASQAAWILTAELAPLNKTVSAQRHAPVLKLRPRYRRALTMWLC